MSILPWRSGRTLAWDVMCCDTFAPAYTSLAASRAGSVAGQAEERKVRLYHELENSHVFIPVAIEKSGVFGDKTLTLFKDIGHRLKLKTHDPQSFFHLC